MIEVSEVDEESEDELPPLDSLLQRGFSLEERRSGHSAEGKAVASRTPTAALESDVNGGRHTPTVPARGDAIDSWIFEDPVIRCERKPIEFGG